MLYINEVSGDAYPYDQRFFSEDRMDFSGFKSPTIDYFSTQTEPILSAIFNAIHVGDSTKTPVF